MRVTHLYANEKILLCDKGRKLFWCFLFQRGVWWFIIFTAVYCFS